MLKYKGYEIRQERAAPDEPVQFWVYKDGQAISGFRSSAEAKDEIDRLDERQNASKFKVKKRVLRDGSGKDKDETAWVVEEDGQVVDVYEAEDQANRAAEKFRRKEMENATPPTREERRNAQVAEGSKRYGSAQNTFDRSKASDLLEEYIKEKDPKGDGDAETYIPQVISRWLSAKGIDPSEINFIIGVWKKELGGY